MYTYYATFGRFAMGFFRAFECAMNCGRLDTFVNLCEMDTTAKWYFVSLHPIKFGMGWR
jgi:hypothetical protein